MKRKLIEFDTFKQIESGSVSRAERELALAEDLLANTLGAELKLHCFSENDVTYETEKGTFVHAGYTLTDNSVVFNGITELVIDEATENKVAKDTLAALVDSLIEGKETKAVAQFSEFMSMPVTRRTLMAEGKFPFGKKDEDGDDDDKGDKKKSPFGKKGGFPFGKKKKGEKKGFPFGKKDGDKKGTAKVFLKGVDKKKKAKLEEWAGLVNNVYGYLSYREIGPVMEESQAQYDEKGNVVALRIPTSHARNEGKILSFKWKIPTHELEIKRNKAKKLREDSNFCKAMADLKRHNAVSDAKSLRETAEAVVAAWPNLLYLTHGELASQIAEALEAAGVRNWDDEACSYLSEGLLSVAFNAYGERAAKIMRLAGVNPEGKQFDEFRVTVDKFYPALDQTVHAEMQVYNDLYKALYEVHQLANMHSDNVLKSEAASHLKDLYAALQGEIEPDLKIAEEAAEFLGLLVEANLPMSGNWDVSNTPHMTLNGDHPRMGKLSKVDGVPGKYSGDWGEKLPVSDGKSYKGGEAAKMKDSWSNVGNPVWPDLNNPYILKPFGDYSMKGEKGVDKATDGFVYDGGKDTWPQLQNPVVPKGGKTPQNYKMKSDNLVVDK